MDPRGDRALPCLFWCGRAPPPSGSPSRRNEMAKRFLSRRSLRGRFSNMPLSYAGKGVVRYAW